MRSPVEKRQQQQCQCQLVSVAKLTQLTIKVKAPFVQVIFKPPLLVHCKLNQEARSLTLVAYQSSLLILVFSLFLVEERKKKLETQQQLVTCVSERFFVACHRTSRKQVTTYCKGDNFVGVLFIRNKPTQANSNEETFGKIRQKEEKKTFQRTSNLTSAKTSRTSA